MAREGKGFGGRLFETGTRFVTRAAGAVMKGPRGQDAVARAVGIAQRGKQRVEEVQERVMKAAGIPGRRDLDELAKQLARIKRKARELAEKLGEGGEEEGPDEGGPGGGSTGPDGRGRP